MPVLKLTERVVTRLLDTPHERQVEYRDEDGPEGFGLRVNPGATGTYFVRYRFRGEQRRHKLGRAGKTARKLRDARKEAAQILASAAAGIDPAAEPEGATLTVQQLVDTFVRDYCQRHKITWRTDKLSLYRDVVPMWGKRDAASIRAREIRELLRGIVDRGAPSMSNQVHARLSKMFGWAVENDILESSPMHGVRKLHEPAADGPALTDDELRAVWLALDAHESPGARALQLMILTGLRSQEVLGGRFSEIVDPPHWWEVPAARMKAKRTKKRPHLVYLSDYALGILKRTDTHRGVLRHLARTREGIVEDLFFPGRRLGHPIRFILSVYQDAEEVAAAALERPVTFTPRTLRRTFRTGLVRLGIPEDVRDACMAHRGSSVGRRHYERWHFAPEKQRAWESWSEYVRQLASGVAAPRSVVASFPSRS